MGARETALETEIARIKRTIGEIGELRPGSLTRQYNVCRSPGCRCKANPPQKHGPYYHLSYTRHGKGGTKSIKPEDLGALRVALANYARLRRLVDRWIDLATELSDLRLGQSARSRTRKRRA
jgi:hypothetical protein